jgi:hypothetical protein
MEMKMVLAVGRRDGAPSSFTGCVLTLTGQDSNQRHP